MAMIEIGGTTIETLGSLFFKSKNIGYELNDIEKEIIARHQSGEKLEAKIGDNWTINLALEHRSLAFIEYLLKNKITFKGGKQALFPAFDRGGDFSLSVIKLAVTYKYKIDAETASLLFLTLIERIKEDEAFYKCLDYLLTKGADVNFKHKRYYVTPLIMAVVEQDPTLVKYLIKSGANVNGVCTKGSTPIMYATGKSIPGGWVFKASDESQECLALLLENGADPLMKFGGTQDAYYWAKRTKNRQALKLLP